jgi:hypothetical protein
MSTKKVYVLRTGDLSKIDNQFHFYGIEVFSSKKKIERAIENRILINRGINVHREECHPYSGFGNITNTLVTYDCLSVNGNPMKIRYQILEEKLN